MKMHKLIENIKKLPAGKKLLYFSLATRISVLLLITTFALMNSYLNYKTGYNSSRLVGLSSGVLAQAAYQITDTMLYFFDDPIGFLQASSGMTWSIRILGVPFTDPVAGLSILIKNHSMETGFAIGLLVPFFMAFVFGRVFCAYICPASLLFFSIARIRRTLGTWFYFPQFKMSQWFAWGVLLGGLVTAWQFGHGVWTLILPYFAMGQTIFHGIAFGTASVSVFSLIAFFILDLVFGHQFTCRYVCPTGRLLGFIGRKSIISVRRNDKLCLEKCNMCADVCPMGISPKLDESVNCTLCGECMVICPANCLKPGKLVAHEGQNSKKD